MIRKELAAIFILISRWFALMRQPAESLNPNP